MYGIIIFSHGWENLEHNMTLGPVWLDQIPAHSTRMGQDWSILLAHPFGLGKDLVQSPWKLDQYVTEFETNDLKKVPS